MKTFETKKLFYNKYLYKLVFHTKLANIFNKTWNKNKWSFALKEIKNLDILYDRGDSLYRAMYRYNEPISNEEYLTAKELLGLLIPKDFSSFTIRTENNFISITSNDLEWLNSINKIVNVYEWWEPNKDFVNFLQSNPKVVLTNKVPEYEYKVYLKNAVDYNLGTWLVNYEKKVKVGAWTLKNIIEDGWAGGNYFYVKDNKTLLLLQIAHNQCIKNVEKLVYKDDVDKYNYGIE